MAKHISSADFSAVISKMLEEYGEEVYDVIGEVIPEVAKDALKQVRQNSRRYGWNDYANGWTVTTENLRGTVSAVVHNATRYQITHLLEYSHPMPQGGSSRAYSHIAEPNEWAQEEVEKRIREKLK